MTDYRGMAAANARDEFGPRSAADLIASWTSASYLPSFVAAMIAVHGQGFDVPYFLEKPYKWHDEVQAWLDNGRPMVEGDAGFDTFAEAVGAGS